MTMLAAGDVINTKLTEQKLAAVTYRISADYGMVEVAKLKTSQQYMYIYEFVCKDKLKSTCKRYGHRRRLISSSKISIFISLVQTE